MNHCILSILLFVSFTCVHAQDIDCSRNVMFGPADICLPILSGYTECYSDPIVKSLADGTEIPTNVVLGFYLNDKIYLKKDSLGLISFDDYFKVYATKQLKNHVSDKTFLKEVEELIGGQFITDNWDEMKGEIDKLGYEVQVGVPRVLKSYNIDDKSFTYVLITKYEVPGSVPYTLVMTMNGILVNERLIWMAHYLNYNGEESVNKIQEISNSILTNFIAVNN